MTPRSFTVETRGQAVVIIGGPNDLTTSLIQQLKSHDIFATKLTSLAQLKELQLNHDPDYVVMFNGGPYGELIETLGPLIRAGESRLIFVRPHDSQEVVMPLSPVSKYLIYSDYVGEGELVSPVLVSWLKNIQTHHSLIIPGDGLGEFSLLSQNDLAHLLALSILRPSLEVSEKIFIGNPTPISLLSLAYLVRSSFPFKVELTFDQDGHSMSTDFNPAIFEETLNKLNYQLADDSEQILKIYLKSHAAKSLSTTISVGEEPTPPITPPKPTPPTPTINQLGKEKEVLKKLTPLKNFQPVFVPLQSRKPKFSLSLKHIPHTRLRPHSILSRGIIIAIALYLGTLAFSATIASLSLKNIFLTLERGELPSSNKLNSFTTTYLQANWFVLTSIPGISKTQPVLEVNLLLDAYNQTLSALTTATLLKQSIADLTGYIFGSNNVDAAQTISLSRLQAEELYQKLSLLDGALPPVAPSILSVRQKDAYQTAKTNLGKLKRQVTTSKALLATTPDLIGLGGRRKYGILFEDNMELRATGGFISSFAILTFENGKLYDMPAYDVYDVDSQLKGHVEPPLAIKNILGEANWYLRDSNFDPDFPTSARRAEWFIKKSLNQDLDGTVALNTLALASLLKPTGPLDISDYNETVSDTNLSERSQSHAEVNFVTGSTRKKEFLSTVASSIFTRLPKLGAGEGLKLITAIASSVQEKNTLISLTSPTTERFFQTLGWNGELSDLPCPSALNCHKDYAMVVDSNFGVNKANYFIKRKVEEIITLDQNLTVTHAMHLYYQNTSVSEAWPAGVYKNYQRLYLPIGTTVGIIKINGQLLSSKDYTISSQHNKFVIDYLVTVPINQSILVEIEYATPQLSEENELLYTWYWQKQPGTSSEDEVTTYLNYPSSLRPTVISPEPDLSPQQLKFNFKNDTDHRITVKFSK